MAQNIFERYGIKEVADVHFEALANDTRMGVLAGDIVLFLDTLKISTIEQTAETTESKGGKGNVSLISWDFNKEITVTLQDALFSSASLAVMQAAKLVEATAGNVLYIRYMEELTADATPLTFSLTKVPVSVNGGKIKWLNLTKGTRGQLAVPASTPQSITLDTGACIAGDVMKFFYDVAVDGTNNTSAYQITIDAAHFSGTYKVFGDTLVRSQKTGADTAFQFVIEKAKVTSETTFTMEAEGDPTVFDMTLKVMRADNGDMIRFIKYEV